MNRLSLLAGLLLAASAAAEPAVFSDVPTNHWARAAVEELAGSGILEGHGGRFHGEQLVNRYQMAIIVKRVLDEVKRRRAAAGMAALPAADLRGLEASMVEVADELARLHVQVQALEDGLVRLRVDLDGVEPAG